MPFASVLLLSLLVGRYYISTSTNTHIKRQTCASESSILPQCMCAHIKVPRSPTHIRIGSYAFVSFVQIGCSVNGFVLACVCVCVCVLRMVNATYKSLDCCVLRSNRFFILMAKELNICISTNRWDFVCKKWLMFLLHLAEKPIVFFFVGGTDFYYDRTKWIV